MRATWYGSIDSDTRFLDDIKEQYPWMVLEPKVTRAPFPQGNQKHLEFLHRYVTKMCAFYDRLSHPQRRALRDNLAKSNPAMRRWLDQHSKLRWNNIGYLETAANEVADEQEAPLRDLLRQIASGLHIDGRQYELMGVTQKYLLARKCDTVVLDFLTTLHEAQRKSPQQATLPSLRPASEYATMQYA